MCGNVAHLCQTFVMAVEVNTSGEILHVKRHVDHPWNELCDTLAKLEAETQSIPDWPRMSEVIQLPLHCSSGASQFLHVDGTHVRSSYPDVKDGKMVVTRPNTLPINDVVMQAASIEVKRRRKPPRSVDLNLFGANVLSAAGFGHVGLKRPCKLTVLQEAFWQKQADVVALQETRISVDVTVSTRRCAALSATAGPNGVDGCIIWLRVAPRFKGDWIFDLKTAAVLHAEPRVLVVRAIASNMCLTIVCFHAPGYEGDPDACKTWWTKFKHTVERHRKCDSQLVLIGDAKV